jgi:hypothetical protein
MSYECIYCNFSAPTNTRLKRHLSTQKHARNVSLHNEGNNVQEETKQIVDELIENVQEIQNEVLDKEENIEEKKVKLCENIDCERYPPDWDFEEDTEDTYREGQWKKCCLCDGYFDDDGFGDILFVQEEPNNQEAECNLCGKTQNIVQMKGNGQYLCESACDESEEDNDSEGEDVQEEEMIIKEVIFVDEKDEELLLKPSEDDDEYLDKDGFECDDCSKTGINCFENLGLTKRAADIYMDLGEPDRCEDCYDKWVGSEDGEEYLNEINKELEPSNGSFLETINEYREEIAETDVPMESFFLDIKTIEMVNSINELITTHPFILQIVGFLMNIVKWFGLPTRNKGT